MNLVAVVLLCFTLLCSARGGTIIHDQVQPFAQPDPVTISEKAAIKFKPQLNDDGQSGCASFPAVNAAGEITGGLKGTKDREGCEKAPLGSQVYGRSAWYQDKWAIVYAWYFTKNFSIGRARKRHLWSSMVIWIDNPAFETPKVLGASLSLQTFRPEKVVFFRFGKQIDVPFQKWSQVPQLAFVGTQQIRQDRLSLHRWSYRYEGGSNYTMRVSHAYPDEFGWIQLMFWYQDGTSHDRITWEQLTDAAREGLNSADFGEAKIFSSENNFQETLKQAYPFEIGDLLSA